MSALTVFNDYEKSLEELPDIVAGTMIHTKHLQVFDDRIKVPESFQSKFYVELFQIKNYKYNFRPTVLLDSCMALIQFVLELAFFEIPCLQKFNNPRSWIKSWKS